MTTYRRRSLVFAKWLFAAVILSGFIFGARAQEPRREGERPPVDPFAGTAPAEEVRPPRQESSPTPQPTVSPAIPEATYAPTPAPVPPGQLKKQVAEGEELFNINFERTPVGTVAREILSALNVDYITIPQIDAQGMEVTVRTAGKIRKGDLFPLLEAILSLKNLSITKLPEGVYKIDVLQPAKPGTVPAAKGPSVSLEAAEGVILQIVPLKYVSSTDMQQFADKFLSKSGAIITFPGLGNNLLVVDYPASVEKLLEIINLLDVPPTEKQIFLAKYADPSDLASSLEQVFAYEVGAGKAGGILQFVPLPALGGILVKNSSDALLPEVARWIKLLDVEPTEKQYKLHYYEVKSRPATFMKDVIEDLFKGMKEAEQAEQRTTTTTARTPAPTGRTTAPAPGSSASTAPQEEQLFVSIDSPRNLLIIYATPDTYQRIEETMKLIDQPPRQVLIDAVVAEVSLQGTYELGLEWAVKAVSGSEDDTTTLVSSGRGISTWPTSFGLPTKPMGSGLTYLITETGKFLTILRALETEGRLQVIASPSILASRGIVTTKEGGTQDKTATVNVKLSIPYRRTTFSEGVAVSEDWQYVDAPISLAVTPLAIWENSVTLGIEQHVTTTFTPEGAATDAPPALNDRSLTTEVTIADGQTLVIGGLIQRSKQEARTSVPIVGRIPILGRLLFTTKSRPQDTTTEIVAVITPRVIESKVEGDEASERAKKLISALQKEAEPNLQKLEKTLR